MFPTFARRMFPSPPYRTLHIQWKIASAICKFCLAYLTDKSVSLVDHILPDKSLAALYRIRDASAQRCGACLMATQRMRDGSHDDIQLKRRKKFIHAWQSRKSDAYPACVIDRLPFAARLLSSFSKARLTLPSLVSPGDRRRFTPLPMHSENGTCRRAHAADFAQGQLFAAYLPSP